MSSKHVSSCSPTTGHHSVSRRELETDFLGQCDACWISQYGIVYRFSRSFAEEHRGGAAILLKYAGTDGIKVFESLHSKDIIDPYQLPAEVRRVDPEAHEGSKKKASRGPGTSDETESSVVPASSATAPE
ncbi:unnamed protein product [Amoebophrya sp. A25]|nr:unnamed protein product [Amoebophrya sp. A25]|eukprot:GSA25T00002204001.1